MSFRRKLLGLMALTVVVAVGIVAALVSLLTSRAFERLDEARRAALVSEFQREFEQRGKEVAERVAAIASSDAVLRLAARLGRVPDYAAFVNEARPLAEAYQLDFLEVLTGDGVIISSAHFPARFGYKEAWLGPTQDWSGVPAFLAPEEMPEGG